MSWQYEALVSRAELARFRDVLRRLVEYGPMTAEELSVGFAHARKDQGVECVCVTCERLRLRGQAYKDAAELLRKAGEP